MNKHVYPETLLGWTVWLTMMLVAAIFTVVFFIPIWIYCWWNDALPGRD